MTFEEWLKEYPTNDPIPRRFSRVNMCECWHASGEYHTSKARKQAVDEVIELLKWKTHHPYELEYNVADEIKRTIDEIRKRFLYEKN